MPDILVRDLDSHTIERLKLSAKQHGRSLQREVKAILEETVPITMREARAVSEKWRKRLKGRKFSDSAKLIREDRER
jgi:plasmid stability protein